MKMKAKNLTQVPLLLSAMKKKDLACASMYISDFHLLISILKKLSYFIRMKKFALVLHFLQVSYVQFKVNHHHMVTKFGQANKNYLHTSDMRHVTL